MNRGSWIGRHKEELDTPALVVDLDLLERNITEIAAICRSGGKAWRPHTKGFRAAEIAHKAIAAGAIGVTCATLADTEAMAAAGIHDIMIASQVVGGAKLRRLADLCRRARVTVAVDDAEQALELDAAAGERGSRIGTVIEVDIGIHRAGLDPGAPVAVLAERLATMRNLDFRGVIGWEGHACPIGDPAAKQTAVALATASLVSSAEECRTRGVSVEIVSCGGTGTLPISARQPGITEIQAGGGVFSDVRYRVQYGVALAQALTMITTVISRPRSGRIICDGGKKTVSDYPVLPVPLGLHPVRSVALSAEHITVELEEPSELPRVGGTVEFIVSYVDTSVHLHDRMFATRNGIIEDVWLTRSNVASSVKTSLEASIAGPHALVGDR
jgi:D-serine deaminase-like pyridoxal phosphate-dependent protein